MLEHLKIKLSEAISSKIKINSETALKLIERPKNSTHGDLAFPCFIAAKEQKKSPVECAKELAEQIELPIGFSNVTALGPFLNFSFEKSALSKLVIEDCLTFASAQSSDAKRVVIDYSSPNIAKPFHVGHLRATLIGNCLDRVYRFLGHTTFSINHLGDWGTQFGFVYAGCLLWGEPEDPSVHDLVDMYRKATTLKEQQEKESVAENEKDLPDVNAIARDYFVRLEDGDLEAREFWQRCVDISLIYLKSTYQRLDISFDHYTGESFYADKVDSVKDDLEKKKILVESKGAFGVDLGEDLGFARIYTPDGRSLYLARDLAAAEYRAAEFAFDSALYVVGAPQSLHFKQIISILEKLDKPYAEAIHHVAFGHVLGMKTRGGGTFIELNEFLDEAYQRSLEAYQEQVSKRPENLDQGVVAKAVARAAIMFSTLSKTTIKDVHFSWDHALEFQGDSGPYLLYACARVSGIEAKASTIDIDVDSLLQDETIDYSLLEEESAKQLILTLSEFYSTLERTIRDNEPSYLCSYSLDLAKSFSKAYQDLQVIGVEDEISKARLKLFLTTKKVLAKSIELLGLSPLERM